MKKSSKLITLAALVGSLIAGAGCMTNATNSDYLVPFINSEIRSEKETARDVYRNPTATLAFFDVQPEHTVVEISPGGGWYTKILAPMLAENGKFYAAHFHITEESRDYYKRSRLGFEKKVAEFAPYSKITVTDFDANADFPVAPANSSDRVLTFRNVHNWYMSKGDESVINAFKTFHKALKTDGVLGVVEHRLPESADDSAMKRSGYMKQSYVIAMAEKAGFKLLASSEVNANGKDTAEHPKGVWTLPPRLALGDEKRDHYTAIGESDRMTLSFVKQ